MDKIKELKNKKDLSKPKKREINHMERIIKEDAKIEAMLQENPNLKDDERINLTDNDSRLMKNGTGEYLQGYNGQIITSNQFVVAADLIQDENDQHALQPMVEKLEEELPEDSKVQLLADAGYNRGENLKCLDEKDNIDPYVSMADRKEESKTDLEKAIGNDSFEYDKDKDKYICPAGEPLEFFSNRKTKEKIYKLYRAVRFPAPFL